MLIAFKNTVKLEKSLKTEITSISNHWEMDMKFIAN